MNNQVALGAVALTLISPLTAKDSKPNIILIMADDLGWGDTGFNGNTTIQTPNLDRLASDGLILDRFYSAGPVSSPTRASVLTGRHPFRTGVFFANQGIMRPEENTLPELLKGEGYAMGHFGKWHLGTLTNTIKDANRGGAEHPELYNPPSHHDYTSAAVTESKVPTCDPMIKPIGMKGHYWDQVTDMSQSESYGTRYWDIEGNIIKDNLSGDDSRVIMDRVLPFIDNSVSADKPFLSVIWFHAPHLPCVATKEDAALYPGTTLNERNYYGCITALDREVGRLVNHLKANGIYENTVILFCSDNGPEVNTPGITGGLRERKRSLYEGGIRVPAFMVWSGKIKGERRSDVPCFTSDYLPLIADIVGAPLDKSRKLDGESFLKLAMGRSWSRKNPMVFCSVNQGAVIDRDMKLYYKNGAYELYNITADQSETDNIIGDNPTVAESLKSILHNTTDSFKASYEGAEYGTESFERVQQSWVNIYKTNKK